MDRKYCIRTFVQIFAECLLSIALQVYSLIEVVYFLSIFFSSGCKTVSFLVLLSFVSGSQLDYHPCLTGAPATGRYNGRGAGRLGICLPHGIVFRRRTSTSLKNEDLVA